MSCEGYKISANSDADYYIRSFVRLLTELHSDGPPCLDRVHDHQSGVVLQRMTGEGRKLVQHDSLKGRRRELSINVQQLHKPLFSEFLVPIVSRFRYSVSHQHQPVARLENNLC